MNEENRRSFVKKSLATSMTFSFSGLIRAHGEEGGSTTVATTDETTVFNPDDTTFATTGSTDSSETTTWDPDGTTIIDTVFEETTWNPEDTTIAETTSETTIATTVLVYKLITDRPGGFYGMPHGDDYSEKALSYDIKSRRGISYEGKVKYWTAPAIGEGLSIRIDFEPEFNEMGAGHPKGAGQSKNIGWHLTATFEDGAKSFIRCTLPNIYSPEVNVGALGNAVIYAESYEFGGEDGEEFMAGSIPSWISSWIPPRGPIAKYSCRIRMSLTSTAHVNLSPEGLSVGVDVIIEVSLFVEERLIYPSTSGAPFYDTGWVVNAPGLGDTLGFSIQSAVV